VSKQARRTMGCCIMGCCITGCCELEDVLRRAFFLCDGFPIATQHDETMATKHVTNKQAVSLVWLQACPRHISTDGSTNCVQLPVHQLNPLL
jgi:hypothetical protein